jgi:hypothetical protein
MKTIEVTITGISPLLQHRFSEEDQAKLKKRSSHATALPTPEEAAERAAYRLPDSKGKRGNLYLPSDNLLASFRRAAGYHKIGRKSAVTAFCAGVFVSPECVDLGTDTYVIDSRRSVIRATQGSVMRHRPKLLEWSASFAIEWDEQIIPGVDLVRAVIDDAGRLVGVCDFRPEKRGSMGRFMVTEWTAA